MQHDQLARSAADVIGRAHQLQMQLERAHAQVNDSETQAATALRIAD